MRQFKIVLLIILGVVVGCLVAGWGVALFDHGPSEHPGIIENSLAVLRILGLFGGVALALLSIIFGAIELSDSQDTL